MKSSQLWVPAGHFYSPVVDPDDPHVRQVLDNHSTCELPENSGVVLDEEILHWFEHISSFYKELPFAAEKSSSLRYFYQNGAYEYGDAATYFGMIRYLQPKRIIEIGSGYSSCLAMDTNDRFFNRRIDLTFIEPYPETLLSLLREDDPYRNRLIRSKVQDVPTSVFQTLQPNDILFIDSSHVAKMASDVNDYIFRILPALNPGVVIHIHDIPYPFEYASDWIDKENRSWNEAYLLRAFLQFNTSFKVIYFNHYMYRRYPDLLRQKMPMCLINCGASIWLKRIA